MLRLARRIAGDRGENAAHLAALSVRAVAQGVVVTALAQSLLAGIGLAVVGIPYASLLTALTFMLTIAQIGAGPVLIPAIIWLFWSGSTGWGHRSTDLVGLRNGYGWVPETIPYSS